MQFPPTALLLQAVSYFQRTPSNQKIRRCPSLKRPKPAEKAHWRLTDRDLDIVAAVYRYRALTARQIDLLFFQRGEIQKAEISSRCHLRLRLLFQNGYVQRLAPSSTYGEGRKALVYQIDRKGFDRLVSDNRLEKSDTAWRPRRLRVGWQFLEHLLACNDLRIAVELACKATGVECVKWIDEGQLRCREMKDYVSISRAQHRVAVVPDGYFLLRDSQYAYHHFLEVDMGTETVGLVANSGNHKTFARKIRAYLAYQRSGQYSLRYVTQAMRVLIVTTSDKRLGNLMRVTEQVGGDTQFWFTTLAAIREDSILSGPIWQIAGVKSKRPLLWSSDDDSFETNQGFPEAIVQQSLYEHGNTVHDDLPNNTRTSN